jgi:hypothetical protein
MVSFWFPFLFGLSPKASRREVGALGRGSRRGEQLEAWGSRHFNSITKASTNMSRLKIAGLCLASMLVMGMALAGNASAALLWLVCLEGTGLTKYENSKCLTSKGTQTRSEKGWQSVGLATGQTATVKILVLSLKLVDTKAIIPNSGAACLNNADNEGEGVIEPSGKGIIRLATVKEPSTHGCVGLGGCEKVEKIEGANLPWETEIVAGTNSEPLTKIKAHSGGKEPGWIVTCETALGTKTDECEQEAGKEEEAKLTFGEVTEGPEKVKELLVRGLFQELHPGDCTEGGKESAKVLGTVAILLPGGALSINKV